jgi:hypothetical protein
MIRSVIRADKGVDCIACHAHMKFKARLVSDFRFVYNDFMMACCRLYGLFILSINIAHRPTSPNKYVVKWIVDHVRTNTAVKTDTKLHNCRGFLRKVAVTARRRVGSCEADSCSVDRNNQVVYKIQEFITTLDLIYSQFIPFHNITTYCI